MKPRRKRSRSGIEGQFISHRREMRESAAWRALSDDGRRLLDRLELEHMHHAGAENGKLICTYRDFIGAGLRRGAISPAIRECEALGFLKVQRFGYRLSKGASPPSHFTLTYVNGCGESPIATDEWKLARLDQADDSRKKPSRRASASSQIFAMC